MLHRDTSSSADCKKNRMKARDFRLLEEGQDGCTAAAPCFAVIDEKAVLKHRRESLFHEVRLSNKVILILQKKMA